MCRLFPLLSVLFSGGIGSVFGAGQAARLPHFGSLAAFFHFCAKKSPRKYRKFSGEILLVLPVFRQIWYADRFVILPDGIDGRDNSVTFLNGLKLYAGQISGNEQMTALQRRIQIRETIRTHIQRERELYPRGIKVLSLFFIDEVSKYRLYDGDNDDGRNGEYAGGAAVRLF